VKTRKCKEKGKKTDQEAVIHEKDEPELAAVEDV
jgi:hypothetical protein